MCSNLFCSPTYPLVIVFYSSSVFRIRGQVGIRETEETYGYFGKKIELDCHCWFRSSSKVKVLTRIENPKENKD